MAWFCSVAFMDVLRALCRTASSRLASAGTMILLAAGCTTGCTTGLGFDQPAAAGRSGEPTPPTELITEQLIATETEAMARVARQDLTPLFVPRPSPYAIGAGDILSIVVWDHPELAASGMATAAAVADGSTVQPYNTPPGFVVDHQGRIQFPLIGLLSVDGLTEERARTQLTQKLARYIANPNLTLRVQAYRSRRVYVDGEVRTPGLQAIDDIPMTLVEAINRAGGMLPAADQSRIVVERGDIRYDVNLRELVQKGVNPGAILLAHGDVVRVHSRDESKVFVSGEVIQPRALTMHNGRLTLNEALGETGGISPLSGDPRQVYVVRKTAQRTRVFRLDARASGALAMAESFELRPKDVVYVAASGLANWNRHLSMLFPGALTQAVGVTTRP